MGKNPHCLGSVLSGFYDYYGPVRFGFLSSLYKEGSSSVLFPSLHFITVHKGLTAGYSVPAAGVSFHPEEWTWFMSLSGLRTVRCFTRCREAFGLTDGSCRDISN